MGLDQYANKRKGSLPALVDFPSLDSDENFQTWRKHANLQGFMEQLYRERGGQAEDFNCVNVAVTPQDLDWLEHTTKTGQMPHTTGFFFGASTPHDDAQTLEFIAEARKAQADGYSVYYSSWW